MAIDVKATSWPYAHKEPKDPNSVLDYQLDWTGWLPVGVSITVLTMAVDGGLTVIQSAFDATKTTVWVSGGTVGKASITFHIATDSSPVPLEDDRTLILTIKER